MRLSTPRNSILTAVTITERLAKEASGCKVETSTGKEYASEIGGAFRIRKGPAESVTRKVGPPAAGHAGAGQLNCIAPGILG
jgi:hypothetical protein